MASLLRVCWAYSGPRPWAYKGWRPLSLLGIQGSYAWAYNSIVGIQGAHTSQSTLSR